jgi:type II secretory pathway pseudopilin PulG
MVTVSIVAILTTVVVASFGTAREQARDAQRQTDLRTVESALALYKNKYGEYPAGCRNVPTTLINAPQFSGQVGSAYACLLGSEQYIVGLAPEFIPKLPVDPRLNGSNSGYVYMVNTERSVYKFMALNTVETKAVAIDDEFSRCDSSWNLGFGSVSFEDQALCRRTPSAPSGNATASADPTLVCQSAAGYATSYAVSAGFSSDIRENTATPNRGREYDTEIVRCG